MDEDDDNDNINDNNNKNRITESIRSVPESPAQIVPSINKSKYSCTATTNSITTQRTKPITNYMPQNQIQEPHPHHICINHLAIKQFQRHNLQ